MGSFPIFLDLILDLDLHQRPHVSFPVAVNPDWYSSDFPSEPPHTFGRDIPEPRSDLMAPGADLR